MEWWDLTLSASVFAAGFALGLPISARVRRRTLSRGLLVGFVIASLATAAASCCMHALRGHGPSAAEPLGAVAFVVAHPIFLAVPLVALAALFLAPKADAAERPSQAADEG